MSNHYEKKSVFSRLSYGSVHRKELGYGCTAASLPEADVKELSAANYDATRAACICDRAIRLVHCRYCGHMTNGRVSTPCPRHPKSIFLMDLSACPGCRSPGPESLSEVDVSTRTITAPVHLTRPQGSQRGAASVATTAACQRPL